MKLQFTDVVNQTSFKDIQLLRATTIHDPRYGSVTITPEMLEQMVLNFNEKVRGIELMLDAGHNSDKEAYGWIKTLTTKLGENDVLELWGNVELTSLGQKALTEKLYGYISADFDMSYQDNENLKNYGAVLLGAGLTNRPVVKRMSPAIELQEETEKEKNMTVKVKKMADPIVPEIPETEIEIEKEIECADGASANSPDVQKLLDATGVATIDELIALIGSLKDQIAVQQKEVEMACATKEFNEMLADGKVVEAQRISFMEKDLKGFAMNAQKIKLTEITKGDTEIENKDDTQEQVLKLANEKVVAEKITLSEAISRVLVENKELNKQYRKEMED